MTKAITQRLALCGLLFAAAALAQYRAGIQGVISDATGGAVPDATIKLTSKETNIVRTTKSNETGAYAIAALPPGAYSMSVEKTGFATKTIDEVVVNGEQVQSLNVTMAVGETTTSVTVSEAAVPLLNTEDAVISGTITKREVENLPSFGRDPFQLARLAPGVFGDGAISNSGGTTSMPGVNRPSAGAVNSIFFIENGPQVIANGTRQVSNNIQVDGVGVSSLAWAGSAVITPNEESIKEVQVVANNYSAENGRNSGAQILVISQNGTNEYHGSGFFKWHRPGLDAYQRWNGPGNPSPVRRDQNRFNQFGGSVGGPIRKNKLFAFFSYEGLRNSSYNQSTVWFETDQFRNTAGPQGSLARKILSFPGQTPLIVAPSPLSCAQVGLPSTQCHDAPGGLDLGSPLTTPLGTGDPTFGQPGTPYGIGNGFDGVADVQRGIVQTPGRTINAQYNGRLDYHPDDKDMVAFSIYEVPTVAYSINGPARSLNQWVSDRMSRSWTGIWNRTFSPSLVNEARLGLSGWAFDETKSNPQEPWGLPITNFDGAGPVAVQRFGAAGPGVFDQGTWNGKDTLSKVWGRHFLKMGGEYSRGHFLDDSAGSARPTFNFRNLWSFANDAPYQESGTFNPVTGQPTDNQKHLHADILAFFVQDDWKVRPNLTLNLGLRYEYYSPLKANANVISNAVLGQGAAALTNMTLKVGDTLNSTDWKNFGPQLGFSWNPTQFKSKLVLRGGFGIGFNVQQLATLTNGRGNPPWVTSLTLNGSNIYYAVPSNPDQFFGYPANPAAIQTFDPTTGLPASGAPVTLNAFPSDMPTPTTYRYSMEAQYEVAHNWLASVAYQGSQTRNYQRQRELNVIYYPNLNPRVNRLYWFSNDAAAHYNALLTEIQHRFSSQFTIDAQYRFSRNTDQGSQDYYTDPYPYDIKYSNGPSDFDVTHDFKVWGVYTPRIFKGSSQFLHKVADGWALSGIMDTHSGFPWTPTYSNTGCNVVYPNSGYCTLRPAAYLGGAQSDFSNAAFMRPNGDFPNGALSYFTVPAWPATGAPPPPGVGRNSFRGPHYFGLDATLGKSFGIPNSRVFGENARLNLELAAYNVLNKLNLTGINTSISNDGKTSNPLFGQAQGAFAGRIVEVTARFSF
ncbi:MAG TPA: TonB-dependent receptor [Bryobacteraceae bacterium]|nr:TonB-dependent receptor [Bryobacteraceae bacterium]